MRENLTILIILATCFLFVFLVKSCADFCEGTEKPDGLFPREYEFVEKLPPISYQTISKPLCTWNWADKDSWYVLWVICPQQIPIAFQAFEKTSKHWVYDNNQVPHKSTSKEVWKLIRKLQLEASLPKGEKR